MEYIVKNLFSENAKYTMEEKVIRFIKKQLDISYQICEYDDSLKAKGCQEGGSIETA